MKGFMKRIQSFVVLHAKARHRFARLVVGVGVAMSLSASAQLNAQQPPGVDAMPRTFEAPAAGVTAEPELQWVARDSHATATALSQATQLAISPLLVMTGMGAIRYFMAPAALRANAPFFVQPWFWGTGLVLLALIFLKETIIARIPLAKKPLDVLQLFENKLTGLIASPVAIGALAVALHSALSLERPELATLLIPNAHAAMTTASDLTTSGASWVGWLLALVGATALYAAVWMASHSINVLILLSPFGVVDNVLKLSRLALLALVALSSQLHPYVGAAVSVLVMGFAVAVSGWSFRLMSFGVSFGLGLLRKPPTVSPSGRLSAFSGSGLKLPIRTKGSLKRINNQTVFHHRRFFLFSKFTVLPPSLRVEKGLLHPVLLSVDGTRRSVVCRFSPRFQGQETAICEAVAATGVDEAPLARGFRSVARWFSEATTGTPDELDGSLSVPPSSVS